MTNHHTHFAFENMRHPSNRGDFDDALVNYLRFDRRIGIRDGRVLQQVHSTDVLDARNTPNTPLLPTVVGKGDALFTDEKNVWIGIYTADCLPVLISSGGYVAAAHCGWRGLAGGILGKTLEAIGAQPEDTTITLGPCAGPCCYVVGDDVREAFSRSEVDAVYCGHKLDLAATAVSHLSTWGAKITDRAWKCTICGGRQVHSYRRDGIRCGLNLNTIALVEDPAA